MAEPSPDTVARRFCRALSLEVEGQPMQWRSVFLIAARARIENARDVEHTIDHAHAQGWIEFDADQVCLTETGSRLA